MEERPNRADVWLGTSRVQTLAPSHLNNAVNGPGIVACEAEDKKRAKYANLAPSFCFVPVAVETLGAFGAGEMELLHRVDMRASCNGVFTAKATCCNTAWQRSQCWSRVSRLAEA